MIVTCPNCATKYNLNPELLTDEGHYVRCTECGEVWHQKQEAAEQEPEEVDAQEGFSDDIPDGVKPDPKPANDEDISNKKQRPQDLKQLLYGHAAASFMFILFVGALLSLQSSVTRAWPASIPLYEAFGFNIAMPGEALVFDRLEATVGEDVVLLNGTLINLSGGTVSLPFLRTMILNSDDQVVSVHYDSFDQSSIDGEASLRFSTVHPLENANLQGSYGLAVQLSWDNEG